MAGTSTNATDNKYLRGYTFWNSEGAFWRSPLYSTKVQKKYEKWLKDMRASEKRLIRLQ